MTLNDYVSDLKGKRVGVIGIGVSNTPLIRLLCFSGVDVTACDRRDLSQLGMSALELISMGAKLRLGDDYLDRLDFDVIFRTPGLMPFESHLADAKQRGAVLTSEMEAFFALCPCRIIAVTGSDGKTTTTTIISELLKNAGYKVHLGGNIGRPLLCDIPEIKTDDIAVVELSSFQLHSMRCRPDVAVITNISPNHLDKHLDFQDYIDAKKSVYRMQRREDMLVLDADDAHSPEFASDAPSRIKYFSFGGETDSGCAYKSGVIYRVSGGEWLPVVSADEIIVPGDHNIKNFLAAFTATEGLVPDEICRKTAMEFKGVEHRLETVAVKNGVTYINDSIATSPNRTLAGLRAMRKKPVIILGGYDKGIPFDELGEAVCRLAKAAVFTGDTAGKIYNAVLSCELFPSSGLVCETVPDFEGAVKKASEIAAPGDTVLFSPACASFDAFENFSVRGDFYKELVSEL